MRTTLGTFDERARDGSARWSPASRRWRPSRVSSDVGGRRQDRAEDDRSDEDLEPGGAIYGQTPNVDAWDCKLFGSNWSQWHVPRHLVLYTPDTLRAHAQAAGLEVKSISNSLSSATGWANSLEKWYALRQGRNFMPSSSKLYPYLTLAAIPLTLVQQVFSTTGSIDFIFVKPGTAP